MTHENPSRGSRRPLASDRYHRSNGRGRRAPALVVRIEVGATPTVVADWDDDEADAEFTRWLDECPRIASLAYMAVELSGERPA